MPTVVKHNVRGEAEEHSAFDGYVVVAHPLPKREDRIIGSRNEYPGVDYGAHDYQLAIHESDADQKGSRRGRVFFVLLENGAGRSVFRIEGTSDWGETLDTLQELPDPILYSVLRAFAEAARSAYAQGSEATANVWSKAFVDGRIRRKRVADGIRIQIEEPWQKEARLAKRQRAAIRRG